MKTQGSIKKYPGYMGKQTHCLNILIDNQLHCLVEMLSLHAVYDEYKLLVAVDFQRQFLFPAEM